LLSNTGQHLKALAEVRRACELEPVNLLASALECQFLLHAGQADEALAKLEKVQALDPHFWLPQLYYSSVYFELGRFSEALAAAEEALKLSGGNPHARAAAACALVKLGQEPKAQSCLTDLLQLSTQRYVPPYLKALACNGLGETGQAIAWLERGIEERDPRMTFLNVEPKMKSLRVVPGFGKILRRVGF